MGRPSGIVDPRRADRGGGDKRSGAFGRGAGAADAADPLRVAMQLSGCSGVLPPKVAVRLCVRLAQLDREASCGASMVEDNTVRR